MIFPLSDQGFGGATISTFCFVTTHMAVTMERDWQEKNGACEYLISWGSLDKGQLGLSCFSIRIQTKTDSQLTKNYQKSHSKLSFQQSMIAWNMVSVYECLSSWECRNYHLLPWPLMVKRNDRSLRIYTIGVQMFLNTPTGFVIK